MRILLAALALVSAGAHAAAFDSTTKGRIVLTCDGAKVSEHTVETEATASAINYATGKGGTASCVLTYPQKTVAIAIPMTAVAPVLGNAAVSWSAPTQNKDGSALTDIAKFRVYWGQNPAALVQSIEVPVGTLNLTIDKLLPGTWHFAVRTVNQAGVESDLSGVASKTI